MSSRQKILIYILSIILLYAVYFWGIPFAFNVKKNINIYESLILDKLGYRINVINPELKMGLFPSIWFKADQFSLFNKDGSSALELKNPKIKISIFRFLQGKCNINYFYSDYVVSNLIFMKDNNIYLGDYLILPDNSNIIDINNIKLNIQEYKINILDKTLNQKHLLNGDYLVIDKLIYNKHFKISSAAELIVGNNVSSINFDLNLKMPLQKNLSNKDTYFSATVTNFNLECLSKYLSYLTHSEYYGLKGILNFEAHSQKFSQKSTDYSVNIVLEKFGLNGKDFALPYYYNGRFDILSKFTAAKKDLIINKLIASTDNFNVELKGIIKKIASSNPTLDLNLSAKKSRAEKLVELLPANNKFYEELEFDIETLVKSKFFADVNMNLAITGNTITPDINGDLNITNAYVTETPIQNGAKKADINLKFKNDKIFLDVIVPAAINQYVTVGGFVEMYGKKDIDIIVKSTKNVDLAIAQYVLMPVHKVLNFELGPVPIMDIKGLGNIDLTVKGNKFDPHAFGQFNFNKGTVSFNDVHNMVIKNATGSLGFNDRNTTFITHFATLNGEPITVNGTCSLFGVLDFDVKTKHQQVKELLTILKTSPMLSDISKNLTNVSADSGFADIDFKLNGKVKSLDDFIIGKNVFAKGNISLTNVTALFSDLKMPISNINGIINFDNMNLKLILESAINKSKIKIKGDITDNKANLNINSNNLSADDIFKYIFKSKITPIHKNAHGRKSLIVFNANYNGDLDKIDYSKLKVEGIADFYNYHLLYNPLNSEIELNNVNLIVKNTTMNINSSNIKIDEMPIFISGRATGIYDKPEFSLQIKSRPNQNFINNVFNRKSIYPIKIKGDITNTAFIKGSLDNFNLNSTLKLSENSKIYYMGSSIGNDNNPILISLDADIKNKNLFFIKSFSQDRLIKINSDRDRLSRDLTITGGIKNSNNNIIFDGFKIKTLTPSDAKLFNIIFKKPLIKQGKFSSDIIINGSMKSPKILGKLNLHDILIPDYYINIENTAFNFQPKFVDVNAIGAIFNENFKLKMRAVNKLAPPYIVDSINLYVTKVNLDELTKKLREIDIDSQEKLTADENIPSEIRSFIINNAEFFADSVILDKFIFSKLTANGNYNKNHLLNLNNFKFNVASGTAKGSYSLNTLDGTNIMAVSMNNIDGNEFSEKVLNLKNQISGNINGEINVTCKGFTPEDCIKNVNGHGGFKINNGKMPKLGSLEYLLNAANLVKGGITGLSLNGLIDLITPLRTGEFESITGTVDLKNGIISNLQIFSLGKNLNLFITGQVNLSTSVANMKVFGRLLKNTSSILGPIGNASLNALFNTIPWIDLSKNPDNTILESINKIPGVEFSNNKYRIFTVDINGDINGSDYVRSFKWIE